MAGGTLRRHWFTGEQQSRGRAARHVLKARRGRHSVQTEDNKQQQAWRLQLKGKFGGTIREDTEGQSAQPREERISIGQFGDTIDASILKELEEEDLRGGPDNEENSEQWGVEDEGEVSIEDIFNIDSTQIQTLRSDGSAVLDAGWDVEDLDDSDEEEEEWAVESVAPVKEIVEDELSGSNKSKRLRQDDMDDRWQQSAALQALPKDVLKKLQAYQEEADQLKEEVKKNLKGVGLNEQKTHRQLRIVSGNLKGRKLLSGTGELTRPMMEMVRCAAFDMLLSRCGSMTGLPAGSKWLDLFAGTGSVGLEALSRGAAQCHFIEMDKWVVDEVLGPNLRTCQIDSQCIVHTMKAESYMERAREAPEYATAFDFVSVCPPYLKVSYPELFGLLDNSPLIHSETYILVEYPRKEKQNIPQRIGPLIMLKDRKFGRTNLAIYGPE